MAVVTLAQLQAEILDSVDMTGSGWPDSTQHIRKINRAISELYDLLVDQREGYFTERATVATVATLDYVVLPDGHYPVGMPACYKLLEVFYEDAGCQYEIARMNQKEYKNWATTVTPVTNGQDLRYLQMGNKLVFQGLPGAAFDLNVWYVPHCPQLSSLIISNGEAFDNATWTKLDTARDVVTAYAAANPVDGRTNACSVKSYSMNVAHGVTGAGTLTAVNHNFSVYAKKGASAFDWLYMSSNTAAASCYFDLDTGVVGTATASTGAIQSMGDGWYRCSMTFLGTAAAHTFQVGPAQADTDNAFVGGVTVVDCYLFGAQVVADSKPAVYSDLTDSITWNVPFAWTNYVVWDVCAQLMAREESDFNFWMGRKMEAKQVILNAAMNRDLGRSIPYRKTYGRTR
jgi:hypothetical protein